MSTPDLDRLRAFAAAHSRDPHAQYAAACAHDAAGLERDAVPYYLAAIEAGLAGDDLRGAYLGLGSTYRALGEYAAARATFEAGLARFPDAAELRAFLAMTLYNLGEARAAVALLLAVLADTSADPHVHRYARALRFYAGDLDATW